MAENQAQNNKAEDQGEKREYEVEHLKDGDYQVHVYLEEGKAFVPLEEGDTIDAVVKISAFGKIKHTDPIDDVGGNALVAWNDHFFFEQSNLSVSEAQQEKILIELRDHRALLSDSLIGNFVIDLSYVYFQQGHALIHKWITLSNPESENFQLIRGYIKLGISVAINDDKAAHLAVPEIKEDNEILLPPQVQQKSAQLVIQVLKGQDLPKMDIGSDILDGYIEASFGAASIKTEVVKCIAATKTCYWYEELRLPVIIPNVTNKVILNLWDKDTIASDDFVGSMIFDWNKIKQGRYRNYFWTNLYGAPANQKNDEAEKMNHNPPIASNWRGRVLLAIWHEECEKPKIEHKRIVEPPGIEHFVRDNYEEVRQWELRAQVFMGVGLSSWKNNYSIVVSWQGQDRATKEKRHKDKRIDWNENLSRAIIYVPNGAEADLPDIFIYLQNDDERAAFIRLNAMDYIDRNVKAQWYQFQPDKAVGSIKNDWECGFVQVRLYVGPYDDDNDDTTTGHWDKLYISSRTQRYNLQVNLYQAWNLMPGDSTGLSDPFVEMYCAGQTVQTGKEDKMGTLNPIWYQTFNMTVEFADQDYAPPLIVYVWDFDKYSDNDLLGVTFVSLQDGKINSSQPTRPKWYKLSIGAIHFGSILISLNLYSMDVKIPRLNIIPDTTEVQVEINILGLRDLRSAVGWMPVNKAYIKFDMNSLQLPGENLAIRNISTMPGDHGPNPNINTLIKFDCKLPIDPLFCPHLTCAVYDFLFKGLSQPLIGSFAIDLGSLFHKKKVKVQQLNRVRVLKDIVQTKAQSQRFTTSDVSTKDQKEFVDPLKQAINKQAQNQGGWAQLSLLAARTGKFIVWPKYETDPKTNQIKEIDIPDPNMYMKIGYNRTPEDKIMHYRYFIQGQLEESNYMDKSPFIMYNIIKGKFNPSEDKDPNAGPDPSGIFKGLIRITDKSLVRKRERKVRRLRRERESKQIQEQPFIQATKTSGKEDDQKTETDFLLQQEVQIQEPIAQENFALSDDEDEQFDEISKHILVGKKCLVRLYILDAYGVPPKDRNSLSDPYLRIKLGRIEINEKDNYQDDTANPEFYKCYELKTSLPGASLIKIQMWDHDIFSDELIGQASIDLEDRFFSQKWQKLPEKPIETLQMFHKGSRQPQGSLRLWVEILPQDKKIPPQIDITPRPPEEFQARLIIWDCADVEMNDIEGTSDIYIRAWVNECEPQETDTHFRSQNGKGSFNWRMVFPITLPAPTNVVNVQIWDRDLLSFNDYLGDASFTFNELAKMAWERKARMKRYGESDSFMDRVKDKSTEKFVIKCQKRNENQELVEGGQIQVSFELVPKEQAERCPVGKGRDVPNIDPFLPPPIGRIQWSWNPCTMAAQMCGPGFRCKLCCALCCILCCALFIFSIPTIFSSAIGNLMTA